MGLYRRKGCDMWWMSFVVEGRQIQKSTGTDNYASAEKIYMKAKTMVNEDKWLDRDHAMRYTLKEMIDRYDRDYTEKKDYFQKKRDKSIFKHLKAFFGEGSSLKVVSDKVGTYQSWREKQITVRGEEPDSGTIRKELQMLGTMFNLARRQWKWKVANPVTDIQLPANSKERVRYLSLDEFKRLYEKLSISPIVWLMPIVNTAIGSGLREGNLINLLKTDVKLNEQSVEIDAEKMKNDEHFGNPLSQVAFESLRDLIQNDKSDSPYVFLDSNGKQLYAVKVQRAFRKVVKEAKIEDFRFHDLRHCFASYLRQSGVELDIIGKLMGQKDLRSTKRYTHLNKECLRKPIEKLDEALLRFYDNANNENKLSA